MLSAESSNPPLDSVATMLYLIVFYHVESYTPFARRPSQHSKQEGEILTNTWYIPTKDYPQGFKL